MRSRLDPMKKFVRTLRAHEDLLMNYFKAGKRYNSGIVEGLNLRVNLSMRKAYGYRSFDVLKSLSTTNLENYPNPRLPTDFAEQPEKRYAPFSAHLIPLLAYCCFLSLTPFWIVVQSHKSNAPRTHC
jgi:hypothetical protein